MSLFSRQWFSRLNEPFLSAYPLSGVRMRGLEPPRLAALVPKTSTSTNSATSAFIVNGLYVFYLDFSADLHIPRRKPI